MINGLKCLKSLKTPDKPVVCEGGSIRSSFSVCPSHSLFNLNWVPMVASLVVIETMNIIKNIKLTFLINFVLICYKDRLM